MADLPSSNSSTEIVTAWERFYHLLGRGYSYIAQHPEAEAEILGLFIRLDTASIEGTALGREYGSFPRLFVNFLGAYRRDHETVTLARVMEARYQDASERLELTSLMAENQRKAIQFAHEQALFLTGEREKLVNLLAMSLTHYEYGSSDALLKLKCDWLQKRVDYLSVDIAYKRNLVRSLEPAAEHYEASVVKLKEECIRLFFKFVDLDSQSARCKQSINCLENQLSLFVMMIRSQFGFTFPPPQ